MKLNPFVAGADWLLLYHWDEVFSTDISMGIISASINFEFAEVIVFKLLVDSK